MYGKRPNQIYDNSTKARNKYVGKFEIIPVTAIEYVDQFCKLVVVLSFHVTKQKTIVSVLGVH